MSTDLTEDPAGIGRRTIMAGAAWTIPAIALATAAPASSAASGPLTLTFDQPSYSGTLCTAISGAYVTVTAGGVPAPSQNVAINLGDGFAFENGVSSYTGLSDGIGRVAVPTIRAKQPSKSSTVSASVSSVSTSSALTSAAANSTTQLSSYRLVGGTSAGNANPTSSTVVGPQVALDPDGTLRHGSTVLSAGVTSAGASWYGSGDYTVTYIVGTTCYYRYYSAAGAENTAAAVTFTVQTGATVVGPRTALDPDGTLRWGTKTLSTGVASAAASWHSSGDYTVTYVVGTTGYYRYFSGSTGIENSSAAITFTAQTSTTVVGPRTRLDPDGTLRYWSKSLATGVSTAAATWNAAGDYTVTYVAGATGYYRYFSGTTGLENTSLAATFTIPTSAAAAGPRTTLTPSGTLGYLATPLAAEVTSAKSVWSSTGQVSITDVAGTC